jgi:hypothetical protein
MESPWTGRRSRNPGYKSVHPGLQNEEARDQETLTGFARGLLMNGSNDYIGDGDICDDTRAVVLLDEKKILSNVVSSQILIHQKYGGDVPCELSSRRGNSNVRRD